MTRCRRRVGDMAVDAGRAGVIPIGGGHECGAPVCDPGLVVCFEHVDKGVLLILAQQRLREIERLNKRMKGAPS